jgi:ATP-dependent Clp protease ATP-binding subunit ClpC
VLFDEIEKAHPEVFNILLQVLDNGQLTDAKGRAVNFRNTVIILTSNIGSQYIDKMEKIGFSHDKTEKAGYEEAKTKVMDALKDHFRPEFLNRLDDIVIFDILGKQAIAEIVKIQVGIITERLAQKEISITLTPAVYTDLADTGYSPQYGARPLKRLIQNKILTPIASLMVSKGIMKGGSIAVDVKGGEYTFDVKKGRKGSFVAEDIIKSKSVA